MAGIMNTLWDESSELEDEILTPRPVLSDDYTTHDVTKLDETIEDADENDKIIEESLKTSQDKKFAPGCFASLRTAGFFALCSTL